ncbi:MAG: DUF1127 domain-containing protein [Alphaproteobacteria bacterium]
MATVITSGRAPTTSILSSLRNGALEIFTLVRRYRDYKRAENQLYTLSTRELDDIGLSRGEIHARVWANF